MNNKLTPKSESIHISVFAQDLVEAIFNGDGKTYVDATLGGGGHFFLLMEKLTKGCVIGFDIDLNAIERVTKELIETHKFDQVSSEDSIRSFTKNSLKVYLVHANFTHIQDISAKLTIQQLDGVMADLGFSSDQLSEVVGLSFKNESDRLDMRLDETLQVDAVGILNLLDKAKLADMFMTNGDIPMHIAKNLAGEIVKWRSNQAIETVHDLNQIINTAIPNAFKDAGNRSLPARIYQSVRIAVNSEREVLHNFMNASFELLSSNGKLAVITFHSGEEKVVDKFVQTKVLALEAKKIFVESYLRPTVAELRRNLRARSAKLFALQKI